MNSKEVVLLNVRGMLLCQHVTERTERYYELLRTNTLYVEVKGLSITRASQPRKPNLKRSITATSRYRLQVSPKRYYLCIRKLDV